MEDQVLKTPEQEIVAFVIEHTDLWRDDMRANHYQNWDRFERLWLGIYDSGDRERLSERSRLISPDTQQAIETYEAEMVEAVFGGDKWFDIEDNVGEDDPEKKIALEKTKILLEEDFKVDKITQAIKDCITYAAVYGKGIGELILSDTKVMQPQTRTLVDGVNQGGVATIERFSVKLKPIHPRSFLIDPTSTNVQDGMGVAIEEVTSAVNIIKLQQKEVYRDVPIYSHTPTGEDIPNMQDQQEYKHGQVKILKYYGLVPRKWLKQIKDGKVDEAEAQLEQAVEKANGVDTASNPFENYSDMVEAIVVIANGETLLKCEANTYMMQDRPIVAYDCDPIPGKFWGRGIAQKGLMMQSAIDAELRMHMDSKALTAAPMMGVDGTRLPRGFKFDIQPGRTIKVNGTPSEIFFPFKFGETSNISLETMTVLQQKFLQATGTLDAAGMAAEGGTAGANTGISLALSGIIKKNRRSLMNFTNGFLMPFIEKAAWRYMQFDPGRYTTADYKFVPMSTLGMIAREYEQQHLMAVMSTLGPQSPLVPMLMIKYVEASGLTNKQEFVAQLQETMKPDPELQAAEKEAMNLENQAKKGTLSKLESEVALNRAKEKNTNEETRLMEMELRAQMMGSMSRNTEEGDEFTQRVQVATLALKELDIDVKAADSANNAAIVDKQMSQKDRELDIKEKQANKPSAG